MQLLDIILELGNVFITHDRSGSMTISFQSDEFPTQFEKKRQEDENVKTRNENEREKKTVINN